ncbi:hypothetical protein SAMN02983003_3067 [Devosia enhydra]|uniref:Uncharacterized protein n=1 Tax=Devosia enhydra TaxID=665118 RepID=A0A1K2I0U8_9HYPH|nr:hypothetical protein [Devosia enhydra]SFZ85895.1 hypothetical protein SAMN02983003_3067 [Devosia enhydra]
MFILRSAFWLSLAYLVMVPHGGVAEIEARAGAAAGDAIEAGTRIVVEAAIDRACGGSACALPDLVTNAITANALAMTGTQARPALPPPPASALAVLPDPPQAVPVLAAASDPPPDPFAPFPQPRPRWRS